MHPITVRGHSHRRRGGEMPMFEPKPVVFLLDDEPSVVVALGRLLQSSGFATRGFTCVEAFLQAHDPETPGCLVADMRMPGMSGLELQHSLAAGGSTRSIVFVTGQGDMSTTVAAMKAGAVTFLAKPVRRDELVAAVEEAIDKDAALRAQQRERQVLELVATGKLNKQIAVELGAAEKTIKVHRGRIMEKMQVRTAAALVGLLSRAAPRAQPPT